MLKTRALDGNTVSIKDVLAVTRENERTTLSKHAEKK